jgi:hypothetical protein
MGWALAVAGLLALGCGGVGPEERSGRDQARGGAREIPLEQVVTDALHAEGGDTTDWKMFTTSVGGPHTIDVYWDNDFVRGGVVVTDQYGTEVASALHDADRQHDQLVVDLPEAGSYYMKLYLTYWYTNYSVRVYPGQPREAEGWEEDPRPEFDREISLE